MWKRQSVIKRRDSVKLKSSLLITNKIEDNLVLSKYHLQKSKFPLQLFTARPFTRRNITLTSGHFFLTQIASVLTVAFLLSLCTRMIENLRVVYAYDIKWSSVTMRKQNDYHVTIMCYKNKIMWLSCADHMT